MREFFRRLYYLVNRRKMQRALESDMAFHREMMAAENQKDFGNSLLLQEKAREAWGWSWLDRLGQDLRFGARMLRNAPGLALTAVVVLALGIGINVTAFNIVNLMIFKPLPVRDPHSIVRLTVDSPTARWSEVPYPAAVFYHDNNRVLSAVLAQASTNMTWSGEANENVHAGLVSANYFRELGSTAAYGRLFDPDTDEKPDAPPVVVLGYRYWQARMGGDATVVGRTIRLNQHPATVIGITSFGFSGLDPEHGQEDAVWLIISKFTDFVPETKMLSSFDLNDSGVHLWARLKPGITRQSAEAALTPLSQELVRQHPEVLPKDLRLIARPGAYATQFDPADSSMLPAFALFGALVLLILATACGNLGNLLLGRTMNREREISIRLALGATRKRIVRQLMTENLLLAAIGSAAALLLSWMVSRPLLRWLGGPDNLDLAPDWRTWLFTVVAGALACLLFGLPPARQASRQARGKSRARTIFMSLQVAASCVLLVVSALLVRALYRAFNADPGFDASRTVAVDPRLYSHGYTPEKAANSLQELESRLRQVPGVSSVSRATIPPLGNHVWMHRADGELKANLHFNEVAPQFFESMGIPVLRGRDFTRDDTDVAIVSESGARDLWPGKDPLQQIFTFGERRLPVVGVVGNARMTGLRNGDDAALYMPIEHSKVSSAILLVRTAQPNQNLDATVNDLVRAIDPALSPNVQLLSAALRDKVGDSEKVATIVGGMGALALVLAVVGLYGVVAYSVSQRTKEIGIRIALGATSSRIVHTMVSRFMLPLAVAMAAGLALAAGLSTVMRQALYGVNNWDPISYLVAALLLAATGTLAAFIPARRALKVDPMAALRCE